MFWGMKVSIIIIEKDSSYEHVCYSEWVTRKRDLFESKNTTAL